MIQGGREIVSRRIIALLVPYFLRLLNRAMPDDFSEIVNDEGIRIKDGENIEQEIVKYYKCLYKHKADITDDEHEMKHEHETFLNILFPFQDYRKLYAHLCLMSFGKCYTSAKIQPWDQTKFCT